MKLICPLCRQALSNSEKRWHCSNNHSFDIAKQGYTNLLPVQNKKSLQPGDSADMVAARWRFLNANYYQLVSDQINDTIVQWINQQPNHPLPLQLVDAGCGEGYYTSKLSQALTAHAIEQQIVGIDISKFATLAAAKRDKSIQWFVANSNHIPVSDHSADILMSLFSPLVASEFHRCLKPEGLLLTASTGADHLIELRELIYERINDKVFEPAKALDPQFTQQQRQSIKTRITLNDNQTLLDLLAMTPHYWRASPDKKRQLAEVNQLTVTLDIELQGYQPRELTDQ